MHGTCLKFNRAGGFGFLLSADDPLLPDIFVHYTDIEHTPSWRRRFLLPGMRVQFDVETDPAANDPDRLCAKRVKVIPPITIARQTGGAR